MTTESNDITGLLQAVRAGDDRAANQLLPLVYQELHRLAAAYMRRERPDHTLQPTALVNEAYMRLAHDDVDWKNREHFIGISANVMRRVLVDYARQRKAEFRGGGLRRVELQDNIAIAENRLDEVVMLDQALAQLTAEKPRQARIVELRYFGGLSVEEIASVIGVAPRSVKRDWALARVWLYQQMTLRNAISEPE